MNFFDRRLLAGVSTTDTTESWRASIARQETALRQYHNSFRQWTIAMREEAQRVVDLWRANPPGPPKPYKINLGEDYELETRPGEVFRNGLHSPGE